MSAITGDEEGKRVVDGQGNTVGRIKNVREGRAFVDHDPSVTDTIKAKLGWDEEDMDDYPLEDHEVKEINDDEVIIR